MKVTEGVLGTLREHSVRTLRELCMYSLADEHEDNNDDGDEDDDDDYTHPL